MTAIVWIAIATFATLALASSAQAATYTVGTTEDTTGVCPNPASGTCSLRQLIQYENNLPSTPSPFDVIVVPAGSYKLSNGELEIRQSLAIIGAGARTTHIFEPEAAGERVFKVELPNSSSMAVLISGMEISGGVASQGGDIFNTGESILLEDWIDSGSAEAGGGIFNHAGTLALSRSLVSGNHAAKGVGEGGAVESQGETGKTAELAIEDSTIASNDARLGAGIYSLSAKEDENEVSVVSSTIADNNTQQESGGSARGPGGGLLVDNGTADVADSILAFNSEAVDGFTNSNCAKEGSGTITSIGYNLETEEDCGFRSTGDLQNQLSSLELAGELQNNGGNTDTLALEPTSAGVDAIPTSWPFCTGTDQRGVARPQGNGCDMGAVELTPYTIKTTEGAAFSGQVISTPSCGVFEQPAPVIEWGDGQTSAGGVSEAGVSGSHTYALAGTYFGSVTFSNDCGSGTHKIAFEAQVAGIPPVSVNPPAGPPVLLTTAPPTVITSTSAAFVATVNPSGLPTSAHFEYGPVLGSAQGPITYTASTPTQSVGSDFANHTVTAIATGLLPNVTYHVRVVATNSAGSAVGADQVVKTPADPPPPPPVLGKSANVSLVSGIVYIELPPGAKLSSLSALSSLAPPDQAFAALTKGQGFIPLTEARQIPVGSILDTSSGVARVTTATAAKGKVQSGDFGAGIFKLLQSRRLRGLTELNIVNNRSPKTVCATLGKKAATAAKLSSKVLGRLHGSAHGSFVTHGQYSAATVRGTIWTVTNQCNGTLTTVTRGVVDVRDFRRRKTVTIVTGQSYLAHAPVH
jgi:hypothetical protein